MKRMSHIISYSLLWFLCFIYLNSLCCRTLPRRWCCEAGWSPIPKSKSRQIGSLQQQHLGSCVWPSPTLKWVWHTSCSVQAIQLHGSYPELYAIMSLMQSRASCNHEPQAITSLMQSRASCSTKWWRSSAHLFCIFYAFCTHILLPLLPLSSLVCRAHTCK